MNSIFAFSFLVVYNYVTIIEAHGMYFVKGLLN